MRKKTRQQSKEQLAYWRSKLRQVPGSPNWYIELQRHKKRHKVSLETSNRDSAAFLARDVWRYVQLHGWAAYFNEFRPASVPEIDPTIGAVIAAVERTSDCSPKTLQAYVRSLRMIASDISGLPRHPGWQDKEACQAWLDRVHGIKLSVLSPSAIQEWKRSFLATAGQDPISQRSAKVSVNSFLRRAKALFSPKITKHIGLEMPNPLPFASVQYEPKASMKYRSAVDIRQLVESARSELANTDVEAFKVFLLAAFAGLRKREIDLLEWPAFGWDQSVISIVPTKHFQAKSEDSYNDIAIDYELVELFRGYAARRTSSFVIESPREPRLGCLYDYYRCQGVFDRLIGWLRGHGVQTIKPLHTLRKEFGSMICSTHGIHAASRALRHSTVAVTDAFYRRLLEASRITEAEMLDVLRTAQLPEAKTATTLADIPDKTLLLAIESWETVTPLVDELRAQEAVA